MAVHTNGLLPILLLESKSAVFQEKHKIKCNGNKIPTNYIISKLIRYEKEMDIDMKIEYKSKWTYNEVY